MAIALAFNPPQFIDEYEGYKMRQLVDELERLHAALTRDVDEEGVSGAVDDFNGRVGSVVPLQADYDAFFLTPAEGDAAYSALGHTHSTSEIVSGTFADARIAQSNVTQHEAAINHDALLNFVANEHIDWTLASQGTIHVTNLSVQLSDLTDVNTSTPTNRNVLVADGVDWESRALVEADISDLQAYLTAESDTLATVTGRGATTATQSTFSGGILMADSDLNRPVLDDFGISHQNLTISTNAATFDLTAGNVATLDLDGATGDVTLTLSNPPASGTFGEATLHIVQSTTTRDVIWPGSIRWMGGNFAPTLTTVDNGVDAIYLWTIDGGTTWYGTYALRDAGAASSLGELSDVTLTAETTGDILRYNGADWVNYPDSNFASSSHTHAFNDLTDVDLTGAANNDLLFRSGGNWVDTAGALTWDGSTLSMFDAELSRPVFTDYGVTHQTLTISTNAATFDLTLGNSAVIDLAGATGNVTLTLSNPPASGTYGECNLMIIQGPTPYEITWPGSIDWKGGAPTLGTVDNNVDLVHLSTVDGGTTWYGTYALEAGVGGGGTIGGSIADNQVAIGAATADEIEGSAALTFDGSQLLSNQTPADYSAAPTIGFGDGDTGFYEGLDDYIYVSTAGAAKYYFSSNYITGTTSTSFYLTNEIASATNPTLGPRRDLTSGLGSAATGQLSLIAASTEVVNMTGGATSSFRVQEWLKLAEKANATTDETGYGQLWVRSADSTAHFTDDSGNDWPLVSLYAAEYQYDVTTTAADPGANQIRFDSITIGSITNMYIDDLSRSEDWGWILSSLADGDIISIRGSNDPADYIIASVNGTPTDNTGWWTVPLTLIHTGTIFTNNDWLQLEVQWLSQAAGGPADGTVTGSMLKWSGSAWVETDHLEITESGTGGTSSVTFSLNGTDFLRYGASDGGVVNIDDAPLRIQNDGRLDLWPTGQASRPYLRAATVNSGPWLELSSENNAAMDDTGVLSYYPMRFIAESGNRAKPTNTPPYTVGFYAAQHVATSYPFLMLINDGDRAWPIHNTTEVLYRHRTNNTIADPSAYNFRTDTSSFSTITQMAVHDTSSNDEDSGWFWGMVEVGDIIYVHSDRDYTDWFHAEVDGITDNTGWWTIDVTVINNGTGTNFTDHANCSIGILQKAATGVIGGSITDNQIAVGAATANDIEGSANLTWDGSTLAVTGALTATSFGGITSANLLDKTAAESISNDWNWQDNTIQRAELLDYGITHQTLTISTNAATFDLTSGNSAVIDLAGATGNVTLTLSNPPASGTYGQAQLIVIQGPTPYEITWPGSIDWKGGAPTLGTVDNNVDLIHLSTVDGGTTWYGTYATEAGVGSGIGGSITDNQIAFGAATSDQIEGSANLTWDGSTLAVTGALTATSFGGITSANLIDRTAPGSISGTPSFTSNIILDSNNPYIGLRDDTATADEGNWIIRAANDEFRIQTATDAAPNTAVENTFRITRNGTAGLALFMGNYEFNIDQTVGAGQDGYVLTYDDGTGAIGLAAAAGGISNVVEDTSPQLGADLDLNGFGLSGALQGTGGISDATIYLTGQGTALSMGTYANIYRTYSNAATGIGNNVYVDSTDVVAGQLRYATTHASYGHTAFEMYSGKHYWYGDSASVTGDAIVTKKELMRLNHSGVGLQVFDDSEANYLTFSADTVDGKIDSTQNILLRPATGHIVYTYRSGESIQNRVYDGGGADFIATYHNGTYGYVNEYPGSGMVLSLNGSTKFFVLPNDNRSLTPLKIQESASAAADTTAYGQLWVKDDAPNTLWFTDDSGNDYPVGTGAYKLKGNASFNMTTASVAEQMVNAIWYKTNTTAYTLTLETSSATNFPAGAQLTIVNAGSSGNLTVVDQTTNTLYYLDGSSKTDVAGSCTIAPGGYATLIRISATESWIMGSGVTA